MERTPRRVLWLLLVVAVVTGNSSLAQPLQTHATATRAAIPIIGGMPGTSSTPIVESSTLALSSDSVAMGNHVSAAVTFQNRSTGSIDLSGLVIAARTPSGGNADFGGIWDVTTLSPGEAMTLHTSRSFDQSDPGGSWMLFASYRTIDGVWHPLAPFLSLQVIESPTGPRIGESTVLSVSSPATAGGRITAAVTLQNQGTASIVLTGVVIGKYDSYIRQFATDAKTWGHPLYLRFAHEMNGNWYPWGTGNGNPNGNSPGDFVATWRHVHDIFTNVGATNVRWVWCVNVSGGGLTPYSQLYPGDGYVDWVALDGYNWGGNPGHTWQSLHDVFSASYQEVTALTSKPVMIAETGSAEEGGNKADWISQGLLNTMPQSFPRIQAVLWFDWNLEHDWRVNSSPASLAAFRSIASSPLYQRTFS